MPHTLPDPQPSLGLQRQQGRSFRQPPAGVKTVSGKTELSSPHPAPSFQHGSQLWGGPSLFPFHTHLLGKGILEARPAWWWEKVGPQAQGRVPAARYNADPSEASHSLPLDWGP